MSRKVPQQKPGASRQDYGTPPAFLGAVKRKLGIEEFSVDLAASAENTVAPTYITEAQDSLSDEQVWSIFGGWCFLNPPFAKITPWVRKAWLESQLGARIAVLVPASVGSEWWKNWVDGKAHVLLLNGRLTFVGEEAPYPKDTVLLLYNRTYVGGYTTWNWRVE